MTNKPEPDERLKLLPSEAARILHVSTRTITRLADKGELSFVKLPSGHRRYFRDEVDALVHPALEQSA